MYSWGGYEVNKLVNMLHFYEKCFAAKVTVKLSRDRGATSMEQEHKIISVVTCSCWLGEEYNKLS